MVKKLKDILGFEVKVKPIKPKLKDISQEIIDIVDDIKNKIKKDDLRNNKE
jgi:hypothetical protein